MCGRVIQSSGPLRLAIVDGLEGSDSRLGNVPRRYKGREWFQDRVCSMPQNEALIAELTAPIYTFTSTGKMVVESKADMKKRGIRSPDLADAF